MAEQYLPESFVQELEVRVGQELYPAWLGVCFAHLASAYRATVSFLHPSELVLYEGLQYERRITSYLAGRYAAKTAVAACLREEEYGRIWIDQGILHQPVIVHAAARNLQVSISHCDTLGMALAFREALPMGLDVERISPSRQAVLAGHMTAHEHELIRSCSWTECDAALFTLLWSAKEALSKVLKTGLTIPLEFLQIARLEQKGTVWLGTYTHFPQYAVACWVMSEHVYTIAYPKNAVLRLKDVDDMLGRLEKVMSASHPLRSGTSS